MTRYYVLDFSEAHGAGLTNQLSTIANKLVEIGKDGKLMVSNFCSDIFQRTTCPLSFLVNLDETNINMAEIGGGSLVEEIPEEVDFSTEKGQASFPTVDNIIGRIVPSSQMFDVARRYGPKGIYDAFMPRMDVDAVVRYSFGIKNEDPYRYFVDAVDDAEAGRRGEALMSNERSRAYAQRTLHNCKHALNVFFDKTRPIYVASPVFRTKRHQAMEPYMRDLLSSCPATMAITHFCHPQRDVAAMVDACVCMEARRFGAAGVDASSIVSYIAGRRALLGKPI